MGTLVRLKDVQQARGAPFFDRRELRTILALYSERVAHGEWRDYAIDQQQRYAGFAVYHRANDWPRYLIAKFRPGTYRQGDFVLFAGPVRLAHSRTIDDVLSKLRAVLDAKK